MPWKRELLPTICPRRALPGDRDRPPSPGDFSCANMSTERPTHHAEGRDRALKAAFSCIPLKQWTRRISAYTLISLSCVGLSLSLSLTHTLTHTHTHCNVNTIAQGVSKFFHGEHCCPGNSSSEKAALGRKSSQHAGQ